MGMICMERGGGGSGSASANGSPLMDSFPPHGGF